MDKKGEYQHLKRTFGPIYDKNSEILILGSFPSVKSREANFFTVILAKSFLEENIGSL